MAPGGTGEPSEWPFGAERARLSKGMSTTILVVLTQRVVARQRSYVAACGRFCVFSRGARAGPGLSIRTTGDIGVAVFLPAVAMVGLALWWLASAGLRADQ